MSTGLSFWLLSRHGHPTYQSRRLVLYVYFEKNPFYAETLQFFLDIGIRESDPVDYVFILQGGHCTLSFPKFKNVFILSRQNDCFDFGAYGHAIDFLGGLKSLERNYEAVIFLNPSVVGPILPKYWPRTLHWSEIFFQRLRGPNNVGVVGTSLVCLPAGDAGGYGPRIEGMAWAATFQALRVAYHANVFQCFYSKVEAIVNGEYGLSRAVLAAGMNLDSLLTHYGDIDWRNPVNWNCNNNLHPTRNGSYEGISVHPFEVVFHKSVWAWNGSVFAEVYAVEVRSYMRWARERLRAMKGSHG